MSNTRFLKQISGAVTGGATTNVGLDYSPHALAAESAGYRTYTLVTAAYTTMDEITRMLDKLGVILADTKDETIPRGYVTGHVSESFSFLSDTHH